MDARSLSNTTTTTSSACFSAVLPHRRRHHSHPSSAVIIFSLKPPLPPPHHSPSPRSDSDDSSSSTPSLSGRIRRPQTLKTTSSPKRTTSKVPSNPLKNLVGSAYVPVLPPPPPPTPPPHVSYSLSNKLWLSSKLSPPPPPTSEASDEDENEVEEIVTENSSSKGRGEIELRQEGKIFVGNLPSWIKKHELQEFFRQFGPVKNVILIKGHDATERNAGYGFVIYDGLTAAKSAMKAVEFDGVEFHGRVLTVKLDDGRRLKEKTEERARWMEGDDSVEYRSQWHEERDKARNGFRKVIETEPENWQAVVWAFERIKKVHS